MIFWNFATSKESLDSSQGSRFSMKTFFKSFLIIFQTILDRGSYKIKKYQKNLKIRWR